MWSVDVKVPVNGKIGKADVRLFRDGDAAPLWTDSCDLRVAKRRSAVVDELVKRTDGAMASEDVERELLRQWDQQNKAREAKAAEPHDDDDPEAESARLLAETPDDVTAEAEALLRDPCLLDRVGEDVESQGVAGEKEVTTTLYLAFTGRKLRKPPSVRMRGPSTSGKSYLIEKVASMMPPESVIVASQMTPQALFYMKPGSLRHKLIVGGERSRNQEDDAAEATRALREMITAGRLSKLLPMKNGDRMETVLIEQEGPIVFAESTTLGELFAEDENRALCLFTDERPEQTRRILTALAAASAGQGEAGRDGSRILQVHHAAQRLLGRLEVAIPFAPRVAAKLSDTRVETRRAFPQVLSLIEASALLHQYQRQRTSDGRVVASREDYLFVEHLLSGPMRRQLGNGISGPARRFADRLRVWFEDTEFTVREARNKETTSKTSAHDWLAELRAAGVVEQTSTSHGNKAARYRMLPEGSCPAEARVLPAPSDVFGEGA